MTFEELKIKKEFQLKKIKDEYHYLLIDDIKEIDKFTLFSFLVSGMEYECSFFLDLSRSKLNLYVSDKFNNPFTKKFFENEKNKEEKNEESLIYRPLFDLKRKDKDKFLGIETLKLNVNLFLIIIHNFCLSYIFFQNINIHFNNIFFFIDNIIDIIKISFNTFIIYFFFN